MVTTTFNICALLFFLVETFLDTVSSSFSGSETKSDFIDFNSNPVRNYSIYLLIHYNLYI